MQCTFLNTRGSGFFSETSNRKFFFSKLALLERKTCRQLPIGFMCYLSLYIYFILAFHKKQKFFSFFISWSKTRLFFRTDINKQFFHCTLVNCRTCEIIAFNVLSLKHSLLSSYKIKGC